MADKKLISSFEDPSVYWKGLSANKVMHFELFSFVSVKNASGPCLDAVKINVVRSETTASTVCNVKDMLLLRA